MAAAIITSRLRNAKATIQSIIEEHRTLDDDTLPGSQAFLNDDLVALLCTRLYLARLERPGRGFDENTVGVFFQHKRSSRHDRQFLGWRQDRYIGEHGEF